MRLDSDHHVEVARRAAVPAVLPLARKSEAGPRIDAGGHPNLDRALPLSPPVTPAVGAGIPDDAPRSAAVGTGASDGEEALAVLDLTAAAAHPAGCGTGPGGRARAAAGVAALEPRDAQLRLHSEGRLLERDPQVVSKIRARAPAAAAAATSEAEDVSQNVREVGEDRGVEAGAARSGLVPEAVVALPLVGIREHGVRVGRLLELLFGGAVARVAIGVVADGQLSIRRLDLLQGCRTVEAQDLVVVARHHVPQAPPPGSASASAPASSSTPASREAAGAAGTATRTIAARSSRDSIM